MEIVVSEEEDLLEEAEFNGKLDEIAEGDGSLEIDRVCSLKSHEVV